MTQASGAAGVVHPFTGDAPTKTLIVVVVSATPFDTAQPILVGGVAKTADDTLLAPGASAVAIGGAPPYTPMAYHSADSEYVVAPSLRDLSPLCTATTVKDPRC